MILKIRFLLIYSTYSAFQTDISLAVKIKYFLEYKFPLIYSALSGVQAASTFYCKITDIL